jgi:hypothetical protein
MANTLRDRSTRSVCVVGPGTFESNPTLEAIEAVGNSEVILGYHSEGGNTRNRESQLRYVVPGAGGLDGRAFQDSSTLRSGRLAE